jgi:pseudouridine kinase
MMKFPKILAIGGAHIVRHGVVAGQFIPARFNPGTTYERVGGDAFNCGRIAARRDGSVSLMSVRGGDTAGETVSRAIAAEGISDLSVVFLDRRTPGYTAMLNRDGSLIAGLEDTALYDLAFTKQMRRSKMREAIAQSDAVLCDASLPAPALEKLAVLTTAKPLFAIATSPAKASRFAGILAAVACLFVHRSSAVALSSGTAASAEDVLRENGLKSCVILEEDGALTAFDEKNLFSISTEKPDELAASLDAIAGASIVALMRGLPLRQAVREGATMAMLTARNGSAPSFSKQDFTRMLALVPPAVERS